MTMRNLSHRLPPLGILSAYILSLLCNFSAAICATAIQIPMHITATVLYLSAWILFFIFCKSHTKTLYRLAFIYWLCVLIYATGNLFCVIFNTGFSVIGFANIIIAGLIAPLMGIYLLPGNNDMLPAILGAIIPAAFAAICIIKISRSAKA